MDNVKRHTIRYEEAPAPPAGERALEGELKKLDGVIAVEVDSSKKEVHVEYDLLKCRELDIEEAMEKAGFVLSGGIGERLKRGWIHFTEENERDAMNPESASSFDYDMEKKKKEVD